MDKMNRNEVEKKLNEEDVVAIPENANSAFYFEIKENKDELFKDMVARGKNKESGVKFCQWGEKNNNQYHLEDPFFDSFASVAMKEDGMDIRTAWGLYHYEIRDNPNGKGSSVVFEGPINAALQQNLIPNMTYVPHTLEGKFIDPGTGNDLTEWMNINSYMSMRAEKNKNIKTEYGMNNEKTFVGNPQDGYGVNINARFNNEIESFPKHLDAQTYKNKKATKLMKEGHKEFIRPSQKEKIQKRINDCKGKTSGVVEADKQAENIIAINQLAKSGGR